ncbi:MAG: aminotransferase class I/II-fold pyridoxal phosphate-dependent enzyme [Chryseolinea sp.]
MKYRRMPIEVEAPEGIGYDNIECNLSESSFTDQRLSALGIQVEDLLLFYGDHYGKPELRSIVAAQSGVNEKHVLITPGAAPALFIVATSLLEKGDHIIVAKPNYSTNIETPRMIGADVDFLNLRFEHNYQIDVEELAGLIKSNTKLISLTYPHNPTGVCIDADTLRTIIDMVEQRGIWLLMDETYREMYFHQPLPLAASLSDRVISVTSMSKSYGLPGIRIGWIIAKDTALMETFLAAKEQIFITNSVVDEHIAYTYLAKKDLLFARVKEQIGSNLQILKTFMNNQHVLEWVEPQGGCVCFPRIKNEITIDVQQFHDVLLSKYKTYVGRGHWFDEDARHIRIGYGWDTSTHLKKGLSNIVSVIEELRR